MDDNEIHAEVVELQCEYKDMNRRIGLLETAQAQIQELVVSVNTLANNMEHMLEAQKEQNRRLEAIENAPNKEYHEIKSKIITTVITSIVSLIVGAIMALIIKK